MKLKRLSMALAAGALAAGTFAAAQAQDKQTIVTVVKVTGISWFNRMEEGVKEFGKDNPNITVYQTGPGRADAAQQLKIIDDLIAKKVSAIAVVPYDPPTLEPALKKAMDRGIKVVTHEADNEKNTMVDVEAFDNSAYGAALNDRLATCMHSEGKWATLVGSLGSRSQVQWANGGIDNAKKKYPKMQLVETNLETNNDGERAYEVAKETLRKHPDLKGFQGSSSLDVIGIGRAVEEAGLQGKICVYGTGLPTEAGKYLESGAINGIAFWDPKLAGMAMNKIAKLLLDGKTVENGANLGLPGYEKVTVSKGPGKGIIVRGQGWVSVDKSNYKQYNF
ncbi:MULTISPECIES: autoinducer 2 ABC transporter substrate-binding protein [Paraburkholderia]|jgi:simple sugar transport system substrate-binding protein|uniref:Monosaccharide ABC transporter substrate-binding protein (CUT2 family) n=1 Tax=Paraburkholderia tropica TaxID=92647 RepID=A0A1A5X347_9BURK|nr:MULTISPECIES: autoinducer 2 ABC transporter substrate-binding protein [Paraburkholderia]MBB2981655.1 simple sugar transport system substrate-binding protein [Paraburkholderia tropica]MBB3005153.1 simple sugar transport system substrate-binding protein [Paraburkholderia tropica]MBB6320685.1 simple sugar transport system substrate-binding protein [Paraburkholderia tropica]MBN3810166.1 autoinducer 2 ABC transporter substrate-binding protein [Paraburkholderia sp. Ac-20347]MDE1138455.1 autoinduc